MATEHIYTVSSLDVETNNDNTKNFEHCVVGSYRTFDRAVEECVNYILERLEIRHDIAWVMQHEKSHKEAAAFFEEYDADRWGRITSIVKDEAGLREHLRNELESDGCYYVGDYYTFMYHFDIDENDLED